MERVKLTDSHTEHPLESGAARLAMCGNVFPGDTVGGVLSVLDGPVSQWASSLRDRGWKAPLGFGLYLGAPAVADFARHDCKQARLNKLLSQNQLAVWTANAFPYGGFHGTQLKAGVFSPDWRTAERVSFTCQVAEALTKQMMPGDRGSVSTCPLGYGPDAKRSSQTVKNLIRAQEGLLGMEERTGVRVTLAIEPEPDGALERVRDLCVWLQENVLADIAKDERRIGVCWDLCHSAVVGESPQEVVTALKEFQIPLAKVQISSALQLDGCIDEHSLQLLARLAQDRYLHQVRGTLNDGRPIAFSDLPKLLENQAIFEQVASLKIHCHVPVTATSFVGNLTSTPWVPGLEAAWNFGCRDFELETYTLPILPGECLNGKDQITTMVEEMECCAKVIREQNIVGA